MPVFSIQPDRITEEYVRTLRRRALVALGLLLGIIIASTTFPPAPNASCILMRCF